LRGSSPAKAINDYLDALRCTLACVSHGPVLASAYHATAEPLGINLNQGLPTVLRAGHLPLALRF